MFMLSSCICGRVLSVLVGVNMCRSFIVWLYLYLEIELIRGGRINSATLLCLSQLTPGFPLLLLRSFVLYDLVWENLLILVELFTIAVQDSWYIELEFSSFYNIYQILSRSFIILPQKKTKKNRNALHLPSQYDVEIILLLFCIVSCGVHLFPFFSFFVA